MLMDKVFQNQIGRNVFTYVDKILVKSDTLNNHPKDLKETMQSLEEYDIKLNLVKCSLGVQEGKILGFYVGKNWICHSPKKIEVILNISSPQTIREVQRLDGRINTLSHFISKTVEKCKPFFQLL